MKNQVSFFLFDIDESVRSDFWISKRSHLTVIETETLHKVFLLLASTHVDV